MQNVQQIITNQNSQNLNLTQYIPPFNLLHTSPPINTRTVQIIPNLSAMHNSPPLNIRAIQNTPALHIIQTNPSFGTILNSSPTKIMHNSSFYNTTKNIPPFNLIHNQPLFNQSTIFHQISNQHVLHESEQNTENKSRKRNKSKVDESEVFRYYIKHSLNRTKRRYHIGFDRLKKIIDDFIVELASSGRQASAISIDVEKKFHTYVSRQTVIRRLKENHFKYRRLFKVPELSESQILLRYNFASLFFKNDFDFNNEMIVFSDEAKFSFRPDHMKCWVQEDDMSVNATTHIRKYPYSTLIWAAIGRNFKSKLIFIDKSVNQERYKELLKKSKIFNDLIK